MIVILRVDGNTLTRVRAISPDCEIDAGGFPVHWLTDVQPAQSVAFLVGLVPQRERIGDSGIVNAIAMHADPAAEQALERFLAPDQPQSLRLRVVSYLGSARGRNGFDVLKKLLASDPDVRIRERAISAIAGSRQPEALDLLVATVDRDPEKQVKRRAISSLENLPDGRGVPALIQMAKTLKDADLRKQAMSALERTRDPRALTFFEQVLK